MPRYNSTKSGNPRLLGCVHVPDLLRHIVCHIEQLLPCGFRELRLGRTPRVRRGYPGALLRLVELLGAHARDQLVKHISPISSVVAHQASP